ncbi:NADH-ubiquinone oxidoreductase-F iron-sulfur binding region domain-containing protein [Streptomyces sp. NBC_01320]|uniref:NADH-ubiquinone oxidoreductase-F iron-sulfur binding region domain-containing protein n=1 Tax=Streptomyces sp. NBC_01320 TaxID=2903824 RepID=UPI002E158BAB|nr:Fe-S-binding domain-containing protein [Streptomyces sp. NBC_01320]
MLRWPGLADSGVLAPRNRRADPAIPRLGAEELISLCERMDLRGRGGSGFPLARKLHAVREAARLCDRAPHVVANGEEGEPASVKDRVLLSLCPDLVLDGAGVVGRALAAERVHLYISDPHCRRIVAERVELRGESPTMEVFPAPAGYVCGEETAVVRALSGGPAKPTAKPPRPFEHGVRGHPTLVSNVETLAHLADAVRREAAAPPWSGPEPGSTVLLTVVTDRGERTLVEAPAGVDLRSVLQRLALWPAAGRPQVILGGFFGGFATPDCFTTPLSHQALRAVGSSLGCGIVMVLTDTCPVTAVAEILHYLDRENAHQCGPCFRGIAAMLGGVEALASGSATAQAVEQLRSWSASLRGRGACGTLDAAAGLLAGLLAEHRVLVAAHLDSACGRCATAPDRPPATRWAASWPIELKEY